MMMQINYAGLIPALLCTSCVVYVFCAFLEYCAWDHSQWLLGRLESGEYDGADRCTELEAAILREQIEQIDWRRRRMFWSGFVMGFGIGQLIMQSLGGA